MNAKAASKDTLDEALGEAMAIVPGCVIAGYVDLATCVLLGVRTSTSYPQEALDLLSTTAINWFGNQDLTSIEDWLLEDGGDEGAVEGMFEEFMMLSDQLLHFYARSRGDSGNAVVLVAERNKNFGMLMTKSRQAIKLIHAACEN